MMNFRDKENSSLGGTMFRWKVLSRLPSLLERETDREREKQSSIRRGHERQNYKQDSKIVR